MNTPQNPLNLTFSDDKEVQDLLKQLNGVKTDLQLSEDELERVNKDVKKCRDEMDRRMTMMVQVDEGLWNSLLELDSVMREKTSLVDQLQEVTLSCTMESKQALLRGLQKEESSLMEQERNLKLKLDQLRKALEEPSSNNESVSQSENPTKPRLSGQDRPVRKRGGRK